MIPLKIKKLNKIAVIPQYAHEGDACFDLVATSKNETEKYIEYGTGLAMEIPEGHVGLLFPRSSVTKTDLVLKNSVGVIDAAYRGEVKARFYNTDDSVPYEQENITYKVGDRVAQIMILPIPVVEIIESEELSDTERGEGGFGSTGQ